jgi:hypothetical protein
VILEDAHWLDSASWALARLVRQHVRPALLVVSTRPLGEDLPLELRQCIHAGDTRNLALDALAPEEAVALVCQRLGVPSLPEPAAAFVRTRGAGNPFFSERPVAIINQSPLLAYYVIPGYSTIAEVGPELWQTSTDAAEREQLARVANRARVALRKAARVYQLAQPHVWLWQGLGEWLLPADPPRPTRPGAKPSSPHSVSTCRTRRVWPTIRSAATSPPATPRGEHLQRAAQILARLDAVRDRVPVETALG